MTDLDGISDSSPCVGNSSRWTSLFRGSTTSPIEVLRSRGIEGTIAKQDDASLRWIQWKLFLTEHISSIPSSWSAVLEREREAYNELRCRLLRAPDGNYPPEVGFDGTHTTLGSSIASSSHRVNTAINLCARSLRQQSAQSRRFQSLEDLLLNARDTKSDPSRCRTNLSRLAHLPSAECPTVFGQHPLPVVSSERRRRLPTRYA